MWPSIVVAGKAAGAVSTSVAARAARGFTPGEEGEGRQWLSWDPARPPRTLLWTAALFLMGR